jgi:hypothetical protein
MRQYIDATDKQNEIRLLFSHPLYKDKTIIVVEGGTDVRLFRDIITHSSVKFESLDGKKELIKLMKNVAPDFPERILGICDADHDRILSGVEDRECYSVYITDYHDAEMMMLNSPALDSFISEFSTPEIFEEARTKTLGVALDAGSTIGILRWISAELDLSLRFRGLNYNEFVSVDGLTVAVDTDRLIDLLIQRSENLAGLATKEYILERMAEFSAREACKLQICCGHDVSNIISMLFRQRHISLEQNLDHKRVESALRLGYQQSYFRDTALFSKISAKLTTRSGVESVS